MRYVSYIFLLVSLVLAACERDPVEPGAPDTIPPVPPAGLIVEKAQDGFITISWLRNSERDIDSYIIYRSETGAASSFTAIDTTANDYYIDEDVRYDIRYYYHVTALDETGNESAASAVVDAVSENRNPPQTPENIAIVSLPGNGHRIMRLTWIPQDDSDLKGYLIYRSTNQDFAADTSSLLAFTGALYYDDSTARTTGVYYFYQIKAVDEGDLLSAPSGVHSGIHLPVPVLAAPADWEIVAGAPVFEWDPVPGAAEYEIQVFETPDDVMTISIIRVNQQNERIRAPYQGPYLQSGRVYYWRVVTFSAVRGYPNSRSETRAFIIQP